MVALCRLLRNFSQNPISYFVMNTKSYMPDESAILQIKLSNSQPVEMKDLNAMLNGISKLYGEFLTSDSLEYAPVDTSLYIKEVRKGSIIIEIISAADKALSLFEKVPVILKFANRIKTGFGGLLAGENEEVTKKELEGIKDALRPVCKDPKSSVEISSITGDNNNVTINVSHNDASLISQICDEKLKELEEKIDNIYTQCLLYFETTTTNDRPDKAIIEKLSPKAIKTIYANERIKDEMVMSSHPFKHKYIVDVEVQKVQNKIKLYTILKLHEIFDD